MVRFPWTFVIVALALQVACHSLGTETWLIAHEYLEAPAPLFVVIGSLLMLICSALIVEKPHAGTKRHWIWAWVAVLGSGWLTSAAHELLHGLGWGLLIVASAVIYVFKPKAEAWIEEQKPFQNCTPEQDDAPKIPSPPPHLLILLLSPPNARLPESMPEHGPITLVAGRSSHERRLELLRENLDDDVTRLEGLKVNTPEKMDATFFNWQQQLRALRSPGFSTAPEVVFVGSQKTYCEAAEIFFKPYLPNVDRVRSMVVEKFSDFDAVQDALIELIRTSKEPPELVVVDITGGYGVTSVAAALFTVRSGTRIQWVKTPSSPSEFSPNILDEMPCSYDIRELIKPLSLGE